MAKVHVLVEGQTEETFVRDVLVPHLSPLGVHLQPKLATTKRVKAGPDFKGGIVSYARVADDLHRLLRDNSATLVTTFIDYYGLPPGFPGLADRPAGSCHDRVAHVERRFEESIANPRFLPFLFLHEFEALVFVDPARCDWVLDSPAVVARLSQVRSRFSSPEEIDEGPETAPSKRLLAAMAGYQKVVHGPLAAAAIGLEAIRGACPHFDDWLRRLEAWASDQGEARPDRFI